MKKILLATTAVALSAGVAAAEVKLSGDARFGIQYDGGKADNKTVLEKRILQPRRFDHH
jgi:outer membrane protein OmpU